MVRTHPYMVQTHPGNLGRTFRMKNVQNTVKDTIFDACAELQEQVSKQTTQVAKFCRDSRLRARNNLPFTPFYKPGILLLNIFNIKWLDVDDYHRIKEKLLML